MSYKAHTQIFNKHMAIVMAAFIDLQRYAGG